MMKKQMPLAISLVILASLIAACDDTATNPAKRAADPSIEVGIVTLASQAVPFTAELPGRVLASATAEIRPQVDGIVRKQVFRESSEVEAGDVLYELDADKFRAARAAAAAALQGAEAAVVGVKAKFDRTERLAKLETASEQALDDARAELMQAQAEVAAAKAALEMAQIELDNAVIRAPIPGLIGTSSVSVGSLVTAKQTDALATIRQIDPVNVDLAQSSANLLRLRAQAKAGTLGRDGEGRPTLQLVLEDGSTYSETGTISLAEVVVSQTTGSFSVRATFANPDRILRPGMFVRATVAIGATPDAFLVPQRAVTRDAAGKATAYFVTEDNKAEMRIIVAGRAVGNDWLVTDGIEDGDRLIVDGFQRISDGSVVTPVAAEIDGDGVVKQQIGKPPSGARSAPDKGSKQ